MAKAKKAAKEPGEKKTTTTSAASSAANQILKTLDSFPVKDQDEIIVKVLSSVKIERLNKVTQSQTMHNEITEGINSFNAAVQNGLQAQPGALEELMAK